MPSFAHLSRLAVAASLLSVLAAPAAAQNHWPQWRGPTGFGHCTEQNVAFEWGPSDVAWKLDLTGRGQSSPVIWGERIFVTTARDDGRERVVQCVDRRQGKLLWEQVAWRGDKVEESHQMNGHASATCATDGEVVAAFFGRGGLHAYTVEGKPLWSHDFGPFDGPWGTAASPIIFGDLVIQNCDADNAAFLVAVNKRTGEIAWKTPRLVVRGWSTPLPIRVGDRIELVMNGHDGARGYDPQTGRELWFCKGDTGRGEPTVVPLPNGALVVVNGRPGEMFAVQPGGSGDVTGKQESWRLKRTGGRDLPSPIVMGDYLLVCNMPGVLSCYEANTGKELWRQRLGGNYSASPIAVGGLAYFQSEEGEMVIVKPGPTLEVVARNRVAPQGDEIYRASPAVSDGQIFVRSDRVLYCIGQRGAE